VLLEVVEGLWGVFGGVREMGMVRGGAGGLDESGKGKGDGGGKMLWMQTPSPYSRKRSSNGQHPKAAIM